MSYRGENQAGPARGEDREEESRLTVVDDEKAQLDDGVNPYDSFGSRAIDEALELDVEDIGEHDPYNTAPDPDGISGVWERVTFDTDARDAEIAERRDALMRGEDSRQGRRRGRR